MPYWENHSRRIQAAAMIAANFTYHPDTAAEAARLVADKTPQHNPVGIKQDGNKTYYMPDVNTRQEDAEVAEPAKIEVFGRFFPYADFDLEITERYVGDVLRDFVVKHVRDGVLFATTKRERALVEKHRLCTRIHLRKFPARLD